MEKVDEFSLSTPLCTQHKLHLDVFCEDCRLTICTKCATDQHSTHDTCALRDVAGSLKKHLERESEETRRNMRGMVAVKKRKQEVIHQGSEAEFWIRKSFSAVRQELDRREEELIAQVKSIVGKKTMVLDQQLGMMEEGLRQQEEQRNHTNSVSASNEHQVLEEMFPNEEANLICTVDNAEAIHHISNLGYVAMNVPDAANCVVSDSVYSGQFKETMEFTITMKDKNGKEFDKGSNPPKVTIRNAQDVALPVSLSRSQAVYTITWFPKSEGLYTIDISVCGTPVEGSPFEALITKIPNYSALRVLKSYSLPHCLWGCAYNSSGQLILSDFSGHQIEVFDTIGKELFTFSSLGSEGGQLKSPYCLATDHHDNIYVSDYNDNWIHKFDEKGKWLAKFHVNSPYGIAVNPTHIVVAASATHCVKVFDHQGNLHLTIGTERSSGSSDGLFCYPYGVTFDSQQNIIVADTSNQRVQVFNPQGEFLLKFGSQGASDGQFKFPYSVCTDPEDNILVTDNGNNRVQVFDKYGKFKCKMEGLVAPLTFNSPSGIAFYKYTNHIVVTEWGGKRFQILG